ncbi:MAG TPA: SdiA-regulated domain-containing protein [Mucilaginibacter sp.]|nr:SdiA-regulated domain-containing protein [Mucilaginibacter sp.]
MEQFKNGLKLMFLALMLVTIACNGQPKVYTSPQGYDLNKPQVFNMPPVLNEISGIAFLNGNNSLIYAEEDETGNLYTFRLGDKNIRTTNFGKHGDYEDVAVCKGYVILLRSDGVLFTFPLSEVNKPQAGKVQKWGNILPQGEFEGLYADQLSSKLYVLCKSCSDDSKSASSGFIFQLQPDGSVKKAGNFSINVKAIEKIADVKKVTFRPSAIAQNPITKQWYILSSVNKALIQADAQWNIQQVHRLDPKLFKQPEGIAFDSAQNLYISNEGNNINSGTILKFIYHK